MNTPSTHLTQYIKAPRDKVYAALVDKEAIAKWKAPDGMMLEVHEFDGRQGGTFRISLIYRDPQQEGKSTAHADTYHGKFVELVPNQKVVEEDEFESSNPAMQGKMRITITLADKDDGTQLEAHHEGLPSGLSGAENQQGWEMALDKLAALVED